MPTHAPRQACPRGYSGTGPAEKKEILIGFAGHGKKKRPESLQDVSTFLYDT